jgi:hypothetical protein
MNRNKHVIVIDTRDPAWKQRLPAPMARALGQLSRNDAPRERVIMLLPEPTVRQAARQTHQSLGMLARALQNGFRSYCNRINRGYVATIYQYASDARNENVNS